MSEEVGPDGHEWAKTEAGYAFVESMVPRADDKANLMWFGWALREAFVAGAEWQEKRRGRVMSRNPEPATVPLGAVRAMLDAMEAYVPYGQRENARAHALAVSIGYAFPPAKAVRQVEE